MRSSFLVVLMLALAGCSDDSRPVSEEDPFQDINVDVSDGKGLIRGVVVDDTFTPVPDVTVTLVNEGRDAATNEDGAFVFDDLEPGSYFMTATKTGFTKVQSSAIVEAGVLKPDIIKIQIAAAPGTEPRAISVTQDGYIGCSFKTGTRTHYNICANGDIDPDQNVPLTWGETQKPDAVQTELIFRNTQVTGDYLSWIQYMLGDSNERMGNVWGASPVVCYVNMTSLCDNGDGTGGGGGPLADYEWTDQVWMRVTAACAQGCVPGTAVGVGAAIQQKYQMVGTVFYNFEPVDGWMYATDGPYPVPE